MSAIMTAMTDVISLVSKCFDVMVGNPVLLFFVAAGLVPVGFEIFRSAKNAAR